MIAGSALTAGSAGAAEPQAVAPAEPEASEVSDERCRFVLPPLYLRDRLESLNHAVD